MYKVKNFLDTYENSGTRRNFRIAIANFFESAYSIELDTTSIEALDKIAEQYFSENRNHKADIMVFLRSLNGTAPLSVKLRLSNVKTFLIENDVELPQKFWRKIRRRIKGSRARTLDRIPTNSELKQLLMHMPIQGKSLYLCLESSGMRIGELLKSNIDDLGLNENPARIQIRGEITKTGNSRNAFFSREAHEALTEWLKVREDYLRAAVAKCHLHDKSLEDQRIFPFGFSTAYSIWQGALNKTRLNGRDKSTGREKIHPHVLRKFFRTRLGATGIPVDVIEALMGHEKHLTEVYRKYSIEQLRAFYLKGEYALLVFTEVQEVTALRKEVEEKSKAIEKDYIAVSRENRDLQNQINVLRDKSLKNEEKLDKLEAMLLDINETVKEFGKQKNFQEKI